MSSNRPAIIGVVGNTISRDPAMDEPELVREAKSVGAAITGAGAIVLTGGHHEHPETSVKYGALRGAMAAAGHEKPAKLIGILPTYISSNLRVGSPSVEGYALRDTPCRVVYAHTGLPNDERDKVTGQTADVFIALKGGRGTAREISAAIRAGRPVVFLNSLTTLKPLIEENLNLAPRVRFPSEPKEANTPEEAVEKAIEAIKWKRSGQELNGNCPILQPEFSEALAML